MTGKVVQNTRPSFSHVRGRAGHEAMWEVLSFLQFVLGGFYVNYLGHIKRYFSVSGPTTHLKMTRPFIEAWAVKPLSVG